MDKLFTPFLLQKNKKEKERHLVPLILGARDIHWSYLRNKKEFFKNIFGYKLCTYCPWGLKILKFFDADPGWKKVGSRIRDKDPGSATHLVPILDGDGDDEDAWIRGPGWVKSQDPDPGK